MNEYGYFDICYTDDGYRDVEHLVEQLTLVSEPEAKRTAASWQKSTWVEGRTYFCRRTAAPS